MFANSFNSLHTCILQHPLQQLLSCAVTVLPALTARSDVLRIKYAQLLQVFFFFLTGSENGFIISHLFLVEFGNGTQELCVDHEAWKL